MNANRRQFLQTSGTAIATAAALSAKAADPFAPAEPGLAARLFNKNKQHVLPTWAFSEALSVTATPKPVTTDTWQKLSGGETHKATVFPFENHGLNDKEPIGKVLHGTAVEWNGKLIGGNWKFVDGAWKEASSAWEAMRERVKPDVESLSYPVSDKRNWGMFGKQADDSNGSDALVRCYKIHMFELMKKLRRDVNGEALLYTYEGKIPGPTFRFRHGMPAVVRFENRLQTETSIHHHGGHNPTHSDGFPTYYVLQGQARDYLYPNILPLRLDESGKTEIDFGEGQSTTWYHDHGLDATAFNVSHGLSGFALWFDELELGMLRASTLPGLGDISACDITTSEAEFFRWVKAWQELWKQRGPLAKEWAALMLKSNVVKSENDLATYVPKPEHAKIIDDAAEEGTSNFYATRGSIKEGFEGGVGTPYFNPYDIPIVLQDRIIDPATGQLVYDSNAHNGYIGNTMLINGTAWPVKKVKSRKYRLRFLDGSNSRIFRLRFFDGDTFRLGLNKDNEWEPANISASRLETDAKEFLRIGKDSWLWPMPQKRKSLILNMANRADVVIDFKALFDEASRTGRLNSEGHAEIYLVNTMPQFDGRGPKTKLAEDAGDPQVLPLPFTVDPANPVVVNMGNAGVLPGAFVAPPPPNAGEELNQPIGLMKFVIEPDVGEGKDSNISENTLLRPRHAIADEEVMAVREFAFERGKGAWMINGRFYDPTISNASTVIGVKGQKFKVPKDYPDGATPEYKESLTYAEEWVLRNGGGGWWHPIHIHLEGHQLVSYFKDFEADGLIGADGILGARAQAKMAGLPTWTEIVDRFGLGSLTTLSVDDAQIVKKLIRMITQPVENDFANADPAPDLKLLRLMLPKPGVKNHSGAAALLTLLETGSAYQDAFKALSSAAQARVRPIIAGIKQLRLQWTGEMVGNHDTQALGPNTVARIRMRFRTWSGPLVFHCHNVEHEDMRMMVNFEATMSGPVSENNDHDPNIAPTARTHGQHMTDLETNPFAVGELPWEPKDKLPSWHLPPVPGTPVEQVGEPLIKPRINQ